MLLNNIEHSDIVIITILTAIGGSWYLIKYQVTKVLENQKLLFGKFDKIKEEIVQEQLKDSKFITREELEEKFVTKEELKIIEQDINKLNKETERILDILLKKDK